MILMSVINLDCDAKEPILWEGFICGGTHLSLVEEDQSTYYSWQVYSSW